MAVGLGIPHRSVWASQVLCSMGRGLVFQDWLVYMSEHSLLSVCACVCVCVHACVCVCACT